MKLKTISEIVNRKIRKMLKHINKRIYARVTYSNLLGNRNMKISKALKVRTKHNPTTNLKNLILRIVNNYIRFWI